MQINDIHVKLTDHAEDRLDDRDISTDQLAYLLHDKYKTIKLNRFTDGYLCFKSGIGSLIFTMNNKTMSIVTILGEDMERVENALVI